MLKTLELTIQVVCEEDAHENFVPTPDFRRAISKFVAEQLELSGTFAVNLYRIDFDPHKKKEYELGNTPQVMNVRLIEKEGGRPKDFVNCAIWGDANGISLHFGGYGTATEEDSQGVPVFIEYYDEDLRVVVWNDINKEDPQIISLSGAKTIHRDDCPF